jgi:hypothetical protein
LFISDGYLALRGIRPATQNDTNGEYQEYADISKTGTVPVDVKFRPCLTEYLIGRGFQADANIQNHEGRANAFMKDFEAHARSA